MKIFIVLTVFILFLGGFPKSGQSQINLSHITPGETATGLMQQEPFAPDNMPGRFDFNISVLPGLIIGGAGQYLGSEVQLFDEISWVDDLPEEIFLDTRTNYGDRIVPVITDPNAQIPFMLDFGYTFDQTRLGISWFRMSAEYDQSGEVPGLDFSDNDQAEGFGFGFVSFWNMGWDLHLDRGLPASWVEGFRDHGEIEDELDEDLPYDLDFFPDMGNTLWEASHDISFNSFQLTARHPVISNEHFRLSLMGGLQYGLWKDNLRQMLNITAHTELTDRWVQMIPLNNGEEDSILVEVFFSSVFNNDITLETNSSVEFNSFGMVGSFDASWRISPSLSLMFSAGASTLSGTASYSGTGIDIDDIVFTDRFVLFDMEGNRFPFDPEQGFEFLSGEFDLPEYTKSILSVGYNMNISADYNITDNVSVMAGYHYSIWTNLPLSPQWSYSDQRTRPYGAFALEESWNKEKTANISASGFRLGVGLRF